MIKGTLIMLGAVMINYLPTWIADQYNQMAGDSARLRRERDRAEP